MVVLSALTLAAPAVFAETTTQPAASPSHLSTANTAVASETSPAKDRVMLRRANESAAAPGDSGEKTPVAKTSAQYDVARIAMALGVVIALILAFRWFGKRMFAGPNAARASRAVQVLSRSMISPKQQLMLIQVGRRLVLVGDAGAQMNPLCEITDADEVAQLIGQIRSEKGESIAGHFGKLFGRAKDKFDEADAKATKAEVDGIDDALDSADQEAAAPSADREPKDSSIATTRDELSGLMDKVRLLSSQYRR